VKPSPPGWPRISSAVYYEEPGKAIDWICSAFGFEVRLKIEAEGGRIAHSELTYGEGLIMVGEAKKEGRAEWVYRRSPKSIGGANTQSMMVFVDDVEAHCKRARDSGAKIVTEPKTTDYGEEYWTDRGYEAEDIEGHHWWFFQRLRNATTK